MEEKLLKLFKKNYDLIIEVIIVLLFLLLLTRFFNSEENINQIREFAEQRLLLGSLLFIILIMISQIIAPISGGPIMLMSIAVYGLTNTVFFWYAAFILSSIISFAIARKWGRNMVKRLVGKRNLGMLDRIAQKGGLKLLILTRVIGFPMSDYISYGWGLSLISFWKYLIVTVFGSLPAILFVLFMYGWVGTSELSPLVQIVILYSSYAVISLPFIYILRKHIKKFDQSVL